MLRRGWPNKNHIPRGLAARVHQEAQLQVVGSAGEGLPLVLLIVVFFLCVLTLIGQVAVQMNDTHPTIAAAWLALELRLVVGFCGAAAGGGVHALAG